jgi:hypothetical protein
LADGRESLTDDDLSKKPETVTVALALAVLVIALIPWARHYILYMRLQTSLVARLGPIWEETDGIRVPVFKTSFLDDLEEIEQRHGEHLNDEERDWLETSRRQQKISTRWPFAVFLLLVLAVFAVPEFRD